MSSDLIALLRNKQQKRVIIAYGGSGDGEGLWKREGTTLKPKVDADGVTIGGDLTVQDQLSVTDQGMQLEIGNRVNAIHPTAEDDENGVPTSALVYNSVMGIVPTKDITDAAHTLVLDDAGKVLRMDNASSNVVTIPTDATVDYDAGQTITVRMVGVGTTQIKAAAGVNLNSVSGETSGGEIQAQWSEAILHKIGTNLWNVTGNISAVT